MPWWGDLLCDSGPVQAELCRHIAPTLIHSCVDDIKGIVAAMERLVADKEGRERTRLGFRGHESLGTVLTALANKLVTHTPGAAEWSREEERAVYAKCMAEAHQILAHTLAGRLTQSIVSRDAEVSAAGARPAPATRQPRCTARAVGPTPVRAAVRGRQQLAESGRCPVPGRAG